MRSAEYLLNLLPFFRFLEDSAEHASNVLDVRKLAGICKMFSFRRIPSGELAVFLDPQPKNAVVSVEAGECDAR
ncbi:MAG: hypothetical protein DMG51_09095 [Acidobacteria bacterium]|nr:MAG: hypothetical protein DMG51_09095 [Acidobacteriota bacterium]